MIQHWEHAPQVPCWWCHFGCLRAWVFVAAAWLLAWAIVSARRRKARPVAWYRWVLQWMAPCFCFVWGGQMAGPKVSFCVCHSFLWPRTGSVEVLKCWSVLCFGFSEEFSAFHLPADRHGTIGHRQALLNDFFLGLGLQMARRICGDPGDLPWDPTKEEAIHHDTSLWWEINSKTQFHNFRFFSAVIVDRRVFWKGGWFFKCFLPFSVPFQNGDWGELLGLQSNYQRSCSNTSPKLASPFSWTMWLVASVAPFLVIY